MKILQNLKLFNANKYILAPKNKIFIQKLLNTLRIFNKNYCKDHSCSYQKIHSNKTAAATHRPLKSADFMNQMTKHQKEIYFPSIRINLLIEQYSHAQMIFI